MMGRFESESPPVAAGESALGAGLAATAFLIWGMSPLYWKCLSRVPALEIVMHRVVWSFLFLFPVVTAMHGWKEFARLLRTPSALFTLLTTTLLIGSNWLIFIWAVNHGQVLQTSLGYYMNPLINVVLGVVFLHERLRRLQMVAVLLAGLAVGYLTVDYGRFPWIALTLSLAFGFYGLLRKRVAVSALVGLFFELFVLSGPATAYLAWHYLTGRGAFLRNGPAFDLLLMASALFTALPLLLFALGARRIHLATLGFLQYIAPSCFFALAVFYFREPVRSAQLWSFALIWLALVCYSTDSLFCYQQGVGRRGPRAAGSPVAGVETGKFPGE